MADQNILALAKKQLKLPPSTPDRAVPDAYINELKLHITLCKDDVHFEVEREPDCGWLVTCLEDGCTQPIQLIERFSACDGVGLAEGFGSLSAYRRHCYDDPSHARARQARLRREKRSAAIPQKRESDVGMGPDQHQSEVQTPSKKIKLEPKAPLSATQNTLSPAAQVGSSSQTPNYADTRTQIRDTTAEIVKRKRYLEPLEARKKYGKLRSSDATKMARYQREIEQLEARKAELNRSIPSLARTPSVPEVQPKPEIPHLKSLVPPPGYNSMVVSSSSARRPPSVYDYRASQPVASGSNIQLPPHPSVSAPACTPFGRGPMDVDSAFRIAPVADHTDENGDFHGRGRDMFLGPIAKADDIEQFLKQAGNAENFDSNASVASALEKIGLSSQYDMLPGMTVALMPHQTIGVSWLLDKEKSDFKGGALADEMGLGKTVQMIAVLTKNQSKDSKRKTTLILAPTALLDQWKMEIELKTDIGLKVHIYHGTGKAKSKQQLLDNDIVITTYHTMGNEWYDPEPAKKKKRKSAGDDSFIVKDSDDDDDDTDSGKKKKVKTAGLLFQVDFYRIILDEAQQIRNKRTRSSRAVTELKALYRWCLTGTPIVNSLADVYPYLRFLQIRPWYDWTEYNTRIAKLEKKRPNEAVSRLQAILATMMLRRMKNSELDGKKLIELPQKDIELHRLEFTKEERDIYQMVETKSRERFNRYLKAGTVLKNYSQVLVLLLRLRQICSHPCLIQEDGVTAAFVSEDDAKFDKLKPNIADELRRAERLVGAEFVAKMQAKFKEIELKRVEAEKKSADATVDEDDTECPICYDNMTETALLGCSHLFCRECIENVLNQPLPNGVDEGQFRDEARPCPVCRAPFTKEIIFEKSAFEPTEDDTENGAESDSDIEMLDAPPASFQTSASANGKSKGKGKAKAKQTVDESDDDLSDFIVQSDEDEEEKDARRALKKKLGKRKEVIVIDSDDEVDTPEEKELLFGVKKKSVLSTSVLGATVPVMSRFLPSTKMKFMMEYVDKVMAEKPDEKYLVISQWTSCLSLVSNYLSEKNIAHVKYQGDMNRAKRETAVRIFMDKEKARIMLMSLKCGGVGLNLTRANHVINLDLAWAPANEAQAFDRVHRLGQTRSVSVQRLVIDKTVEDRILALQERKQNLADGSLGEGKGKKLGRLSVAELAGLFGLDARGRVIQN